MKREKADKDGVIQEGKLNEIITKVTIRPDGSRRIQQDFSACPSLAEQHTQHLSDVNYLMEKYKPDELAAYLHSRNQYRREILGHDFSVEPNLQDAKNVVYQSKQHFLNLPEEVQTQFKNHLEFLKFVDNPQNAQKLIKLGILTAEQLKEIQIPEQFNPNAVSPPPKPTSEAPPKEKA